VKAVVGFNHTSYSRELILQMCKNINMSEESRSKVQGILTDDLYPPGRIYDGAVAAGP
jgi:hypothetical protein